MNWKKPVKLSSCQDVTVFNDEECSLNAVHNAMKKLIHILQQAIHILFEEKWQEVLYFPFFTE